MVQDTTTRPEAIHDARRALLGIILIVNVLIWIVPVLMGVGLLEADYSVILTSTLISGLVTVGLIFILMEIY